MMHQSHIILKMIKLLLFVVITFPVFSSSFQSHIRTGAKHKFVTILYRNKLKSFRLNAKKKKNNQADKTSSFWFAVEVDSGRALGSNDKNKKKRTMSESNKNNENVEEDSSAKLTKAAAATGTTFAAARTATTVATTGGIASTTIAGTTTTSGTAAGIVATSSAATAGSATTTAGTIAAARTAATVATGMAATTSATTGTTSTAAGTLAVARTAATVATGVAATTSATTSTTTTAAGTVAAARTAATVATGVAATTSSTTVTTTTAAVTGTGVVARTATTVATGVAATSAKTSTMATAAVARTATSVASTAAAAAAGTSSAKVAGITTPFFARTIGSATVGAAGALSSTITTATTTASVSRGVLATGSTVAGKKASIFVSSRVATITGGAVAVDAALDGGATGTLGAVVDMTTANGAAAAGAASSSGLGDALVAAGGEVIGDVSALVGDAVVDGMASVGTAVADAAVGLATDVAIGGGTIWGLWDGLDRVLPRWLFSGGAIAIGGEVAFTLFAFIALKFANTDGSEERSNTQIQSSVGEVAYPSEPEAKSDSSNEEDVAAQNIMNCFTSINEGDTININLVIAEAELAIEAAEMALGEEGNVVDSDIKTQTSSIQIQISDESVAYPSEPEAMSDSHEQKVIVAQDNKYNITTINPGDDFDFSLTEAQMAIKVVEMSFGGEGENIKTEIKTHAEMGYSHQPKCVITSSNDNISIISSKRDVEISNVLLEADLKKIEAALAALLDAQNIKSNEMIFDAKVDSPYTNNTVAKLSKDKITNIFKKNSTDINSILNEAEVALNLADEALSETEDL